MRLLRIARPQTDESFMSYIIRLTELNFYDTPSWVLRRAGFCPEIFIASYRFMFQEVEVSDLSLFAELTGISEPELLSLAYTSVNQNQVYRDSITTFGAPLPKFMIRVRYGKVCPACLRDANYCRKLWDLAPVTACPIHKCILLDECPNCKKRLAWTRNKISICRCGFDWRSIRLKSIKDLELTVVQRIHQLCSQSSNEFTTKANSTNPLLELDLEHFILALFFVAGRHQGITETRGRSLAPTLRNAELHQLLAKTFYVFYEWPRQYHLFLDWLNKEDIYEGKGQILRKGFRAYEYSLYRLMSSREYDFMRHEFEEYAKENLE